jgi:broad specificity phosphatase PhoE
MIHWYLPLTLRTAAIYHSPRKRAQAKAQAILLALDNPCNIKKLAEGL